MLKRLFFTLNTYMAIKIPVLEASIERSVKNYTYKDIALDITRATTGFNGVDEPLYGNDISACYDTQAIVNSLYNLFNTRKGERYLFPEYGSDLSRYLFSPLTNAIAGSIGDSIKKTIKTFEPRITVDAVAVVIIEDENTLNVEVKYTVNVTKQTATATLYLKQNNPILISNNN